MDDETKQLLQEIRDELRLIREQTSLATSRQTIFFPLLALVKGWRIAADGAFRAHQADPEKNPTAAGRLIAYSKAADELEAWIKTGALRLDASDIERQVEAKLFKTLQRSCSPRSIPDITSTGDTR